MKLSTHAFLVAFWLCCCFSQSATAQHQPSIADYMTEANHLMDEGKLADAIPYLDYVLNQKATHQDARFNRAICNYELAHYKSAIFDFNYVIQDNPMDLESYELRAIAYDAIGQYNNALADFSKILEHKRTSLTLVNRGFASLKAHNYRVAIMDFQDAIRMQPSNSRAYAGLGEVYFTLKRYQEAIDNFDIAIQLNPSDAFLYNNRGDAKMRLTDANLGGAYYDFYQALSLDQAPIFYSNMAHLFIKMEDWDQAKRAAISAMELDDNHAEAYFVVSLLETEWGVLQQAARSLDIAIDIAPNSPTYNNYMGDTQFELGNYFEAISYYNVVVDLDPRYEGIEGRIARAFSAANANMEANMVERGIPMDTLSPQAGQFTTKGATNTTSTPVHTQQTPTQYEVIQPEPIIEYEVDNLRMLRVKTPQPTPKATKPTAPSTTPETIEEDMFGEGF